MDGPIFLYFFKLFVIFQIKFLLIEKFGKNEKIFYIKGHKVTYNVIDRV